METSPLYAQIAIHLPLDKVFTYLVPTKLAQEIALGKRVLIPFKNRKLIGHVVYLGTETPVQEPKEILAVLDTTPVISRALLGLSKWIADYYLTPWGSVLSSALPSGLGVRKKSIPVKTLNFVRLVIDCQDETQNLKQASFLQTLVLKAPKQAAVLNTLKAKGEMSSAELLRATKATSLTIRTLMEKGLVEVYEKEIRRGPTRWIDPSAEKSIIPNPDQILALEQITKALSKEEFVPFLLHGVTGSGKTYVYLKAVEQTLKMGKTAIMMVPEISLTHQLMAFFYHALGDQMAVLHSGLSEGERVDEWRRILLGEAKVAIGARSAIFAPLGNLGLIILDEEHETSYKQDNSPRYHAREVALIRAKQERAVILLGSATPSLESYQAAHQNNFHLLHLPKRATQHSLAQIRLVDMRKEKGTQGKRSIFSRSLLEAIHHRLSRREQVILFLNRRGFSRFLQCGECGYVPKCRNCSVSLTYHADEDRLRCHYCNYLLMTPQICPQCHKGFLRDVGYGTQKIEEEMRELFPSARLERMDQDTVTKKFSAHHILSRLGKGEIDILIGTQMIAKGLDFPKVTLVGVIAADTLLNFPDFRSAERTFQLITQVSGRAGRGEVPGEVIVQTFNPDHYSLNYACRMDYQSFFDFEMRYRKELDYPPFSRMVNIIVKAGELNALKVGVDRLMNFLISFKPEEVILLGPAPAPIEKIRGQFRYQILLKSSHNFTLNSFVRKALLEFQAGYSPRGLQIDIDVDPLQLM